MRLDPGSTRRRRFGFMTLEFVVALGIFSAAMLPLAFSTLQERRLARGYYYRAVALEIVDGEMELVMAGNWRALPQGTHLYPVHAEAAANLPPGQFLLTRNAAQVRLEWRPARRGVGGTVVREVRIASPNPSGVLE